LLITCGDMSGEGALVNEQRAARDVMPAGVEAMSAKRQRAEEAVEELRGECVRQGEEAEKVRVDATEAAAKVMEDAETQAAEILRLARADRAALDAEKAAMEKTYAFQIGKIKLDVGGHKFTTSKTTLTSVPDTYLNSLVSGRYLLSADADGMYFIDRDGAHFGHILNYLRDPGRDY